MPSWTTLVGSVCVAVTLYVVFTASGSPTGGRSELGMLLLLNPVIALIAIILYRSFRSRDTVTGTLNHRSMQEAVEQALQQAHQQQRSFSVLRMDIDRFGLLNATYGHTAGDEVLQRVGNLLRTSLPPNAVLGRYDADEFLIILPDTERSQAAAIASRLREKVREASLVHSTNGLDVPVTVSIGIATFPTDAATVRGLLSVAEEALSIARQDGQGVADSQSSWRTRYRIHMDGAFSTLEAMVIAIDNKDHYTRRHSEDVTDYALWIAEQLGLSEEQKHTLRLGGLLHDVGKIGIPDAVLLKPGLLTAEEYEVMKQHTVLGAVMLAAVPGMEEAVPLARSHHERWDGQGYPDGLAGEQIPLLARLLSVADAFSAMTTDRPYRKGMDWSSALRELQRHRGTQFDPVMVDAFVAAVRKRMENRLPEQKEAPRAA